MNNLFESFCRCNSGFGHCNGNLPNKRSQPLARNAFLSLSDKEKDEVYEDLYGTDDRAKETPDFISKKLEELDKQIDRLSPDAKEYYTRAIDCENQHIESGGERYISSDKFRLMFLRADRFDAKMAGRRLTTNLKEKCKLFGEDKLAHRITQADLNEEDKKALYSGAMNFTGATDRAGRPILFGCRQQVLKQNIVSMMRATYYMIHSVLEANEDLQRKGVIFIGYNVRDKNSPAANPSTARATLPLPRLAVFALPIWLAGIHICYNNAREHVFLNIFLVVLPRHYRARYQCHYVTGPEECVFNLESYGIDSEALHFKSNGNFRTERWHEYLEAQRQVEDQTFNSTV